MPDVRVKAYAAAVVIFALDRLSKWLIETRVSVTDTIAVIPGLFNIVHSENRGVAFGMFNDSTSPWRTVILVLLAVSAVAFIAGMLWKPEKLERLSYWGLALLLGGALGNVFDRVLWGRVTDFLDFYIAGHHWYTFNVADGAVVIGSGLLLLDMLKPKRQAANVP